MNPLHILVVIGSIVVNCSAELQQFNLCSEKSFFNVISAGQAHVTSTTVYVVSELQCCRKCGVDTNCIGVNIIRDPTAPYQMWQCELIIAPGGNITLLDPCLLTEEVDDSKFYKKGHQESSSNKVFEIDSTGTVIYGSASEIDNKLKQGERMRILLKNFNNSAEDLLVRADIVHMNSGEMCAQSVSRFRWVAPLLEVYRVIMHVCITGRVEMQVWRLWAEMTSKDTLMIAASVWYSDGRPKTQVISTNGFGDLDTLRNAIYSGQDIITYRSNMATPNYNVRINASEIAIEYPWAVSLTNVGAAIQFSSSPYWFATVHSNITDLFITRFDMEDSELISNNTVPNYYKAYLLDTLWTQIEYSELQTHLDHGKQLRIVVGDRVETVDLILQEFPSGDFLFILDGIVETYGPDVRQVFYIINSNTMQKYIVDNDNFAYEYVEANNVTINWFVEDKTWTLIHTTSRYGTTSDSGLDLVAAFYNGKEFRIKFAFNSTHYYYVTADSVSKTGNIFFATYYGFFDNVDGGYGRQIHLTFWSDGTIRIAVKSSGMLSAEIMKTYFDMWWFVC